MHHIPSKPIKAREANALHFVEDLIDTDIYRPLLHIKPLRNCSHAHLRKSGVGGRLVRRIDGLNEATFLAGIFREAPADSFFVRIMLTAKFEDAYSAAPVVAY